MNSLIKNLFFGFIIFYIIAWALYISLSLDCHSFDDYDNKDKKEKIQINSSE